MTSRRQNSSGAVPTAASNRLSTMAGPARAAVFWLTSAITLPPISRVSASTSRWSLPNRSNAARPLRRPAPLSSFIASSLDAIQA